MNKESARGKMGRRKRARVVPAFSLFPSPTEACYSLIGHFRVPDTHFQNEAKCKTSVKISFICKRMKYHFHINCFALCLALDLEATPK